MLHREIMKAFIFIYVYRSIITLDLFENVTVVCLREENQEVEILFEIYLYYYYVS